MRCERSILRILGLVVLLNCTELALTSDSPLPQPVAVVDDMQPTSNDPSLTTVAFLSDTTIEVAACPTVRRDATCSFAFFRWENGILKHSEEPVNVKTGGFVELVESTPSADGRRMFVDFNDKEVPKFQHVLDCIRTVATLGMSADEDVNREVVQVADTATRKTCFDWRRTFPSTYYRMRAAAMSPSGEFVAIKLGNELSIYRLPAVCEGPRATRRK
jgi:hypothetical protein